jgi:site-specific DNA-adenine methylase
MVQNKSIWLKHRGGPLQYFGNRNLTLPTVHGIMEVDLSWMHDSFTVVLANLEEDSRFDRCFEPFAGSAAWSLNAMEIGLSKEYFINDSNQALIDFFRTVQVDPTRVKEVYALLVQRYVCSCDKESEFNSIISEYNRGNDVKKSLLISFIVNYSWGGMVFHDDKGQIVYRRHVINGIEIPGCIENPTLSLSHYYEEIDKVSILLNANKVHFTCCDFEEIIPKDLDSKDFLILNPPYPENERHIAEKFGLYFELYPHQILHEKLCQLIATCEVNNASYFMSYGLHNPETEQFRIRDASHQTNYYLRIIGFENCIFDRSLDQVYFSKKFRVPEQLSAKLIPAREILQSSRLNHQEALRMFMKQAQERNSSLV